ncbi:MAG TPA: hypothetical protein VJV23_07825, partial [Candidatus Polarisedimenticolia bacterium]|nr:hypothetical protein [Candidatus Polarisedimenticolia bacterium]
MGREGAGGAPERVVRRAGRGPHHPPAAAAAAATAPSGRCTLAQSVGEASRSWGGRAADQQGRQAHVDGVGGRAHLGEDLVDLEG